MAAAMDLTQEYAGDQIGLEATFDYEGGQDGFDQTQDYTQGSHQHLTANLTEEHYARLDTHVTGAHVKPFMKPEEKLALTIAFKRKEEMERRNRILNAKTRTIGLDKEALDAQCAENAARRQSDAQSGKKNDQEVVRMDRYLKLLDKQKNEERRASEKACKDYSLQNLNYESRREFDLNDKKHLQKARPCRDGDEDPRCGPASMQKFAGEDLTGPERKRQQQKYMVDIIEQQQFEKHILQAQDDGKDKAFSDEVAEITAIRNEMEANEKGLRRELNKSQQESNLNKASENIAAKRDQAMLEQERNQAELEHHANDPFLNEHSNHFLENGKIRRDAFKGADRAGRIQVANLLQEQAYEQAAARQQDKGEERAHHRQMEQTRKQLVAMDREKARMRREMATSIAQENLVARQQQHANQKATKQLYTNEFSGEFFEQFGRGSR